MLLLVAGDNIGDSLSIPMHYNTTFLKWGMSFPLNQILLMQMWGIHYDYIRSYNYYPVRFESGTSGL